MTGYSIGDLTHDLSGATRVVPRSLKLLVTGSRRWDHPRSVYAVLDYVLRFSLVMLPASLAIGHGDAYKGADAITEAWTQRQRRAVPRLPVGSHRFPADWEAPCRAECPTGHRGTRRRGGGIETYCPWAGHYRNQEMVDAGPEMCAGFLRDGSSGTSDCLRRAREAGVPTFELPWEQRGSALEYVKGEWDLDIVRRYGGWGNSSGT